MTAKGVSAYAMQRRQEKGRTQEPVGVQRPGSIASYLGSPSGQSEPPGRAGIQPPTLHVALPTLGSKRAVRSVPYPQRNLGAYLHPRGRR